MSAEKTGIEKGKLCADLKDIETDMVRELIRLYEQGTDYELFWERVGRVEQFGRLRRNSCHE